MSKKLFSIAAAGVFALGMVFTSTTSALADQPEHCGYYESPSGHHYAINCWYQPQKFSLSIFPGGTKEVCLAGKEWYEESLPLVIVGASSRGGC